MRLKHIKSVMVVDDDPQFVEHLTGILKNEGISVKSASNCLDALLIVSEDIPDLILIDQVMPTISCNRLCNVLRSQPQLADSYRVMLSTITDKVNIDVEAVGAHAFVAKEPGRLLAANLIRVLKRLDEKPNGIQPDTNRISRIEIEP